MQSQFLFEESSLIRKQREEIILLTNELKNQEVQLNLFNNEMSKVKSTIRIYDKKLEEADTHAKVYINQIKELKNQIDDRDKEIESLKSKLNNKEAFFNKKLLKLTQCEFAIDKLNKELTSESTTVKELRNENAKLLLKLGEQSNRCKEVKFKNDELSKTIETKNSLLDVAKDQIVNLETKLNSLIELFNAMKTDDEVKSITNVNQSSGEHNSTWHNVSFDEKKLNNPNYLINLITNMLSNKHDTKLNNLLQSLKERWFETNVICEQIKGFLSAKYPKKLTQTETDPKVVNLTSKSTDRHTSTPVNF